MATFRPMLAAKAPAELCFPMLVSPKLDGVRCLIKNGQALARSLKPIPNHHVQLMLSHPALEGMDGELVVGSPTAPDAYRKTTSAVMAADGEPQFTFWVFDLHDHPGTFEERLAALQERIAVLEVWDKHGHHTVVKLVNHNRCHSPDQVAQFENEWVANQGFEGLMLRHPGGPYKYGRSTTNEGYLLKLKQFEDSEAKVVGVEELQHNLNQASTNALGLTERSTQQAGKAAGGCLGALVVDWNGIVFRIGTGFSTDQRHALWQERDQLPGRTAKFKYFPVGMKAAPRHPVFLGWRSSLDME